ncbi:hypothetical protein OG21DRAFT_1426746, partial [Imleria badia]
FLHISAHLPVVANHRISYFERNSLFLSGLPDAVCDCVQLRLEIVHPDVDLDDSYAMNDITAATMFLLSSSTFIPASFLLRCHLLRSSSSGLIISPFFDLILSYRA